MTMSKNNLEPAKKLLDKRRSARDDDVPDMGIPGARRRSQSGVILNELSYPPTKQELDKYVDVPEQTLPPKYKRPSDKRVYVNRNVSLNEIEWFGYDMDYTLAQYKSPDYEELGYNLVRDRLVEYGYPEEIGTLRYDRDFPLRGLFFDVEAGNLVKVDGFGNILLAVHGHTKLTPQEISQLYPNSFVLSDEIGKRYSVLNTLFNLPETCLIADLVTFFDSHTEFEKTSSGFQSETIVLSYQNIYQDLRLAVDHVHLKGQLKDATVANLEKYVEKEEQLPRMLDKIREGGRKTFLATNSEYAYTNIIMTYLTDFSEEGGPSKHWKEYFDVIICDAKKPLFFTQGSSLREVDETTGDLKIGSVKGKFQPGKIYTGGSSALFCEYTGAAGKSILYFGDHIFGDILKSKKTHAWRTLLVVPEMTRELAIQKNVGHLVTHLHNLDFMIAETFRDLDVDASEEPDVTGLKKKIHETEKAMDDAFNPTFGGLFRSGTRQTFFANQARRYADLYASKPWNILNYPLFYEFRYLDEPMPHQASSV